jgi:hypothetical protein
VRDKDRVIPKKQIAMFMADGFLLVLPGAPEQRHDGRHNVALLTQKTGQYVQFRRFCHILLLRKWNGAA